MNKFLTFMTVLGMLTLTSGVSFSEDYQHCNAFRQTAEGVAGLRDAGVSRLNAKTMVRDVLVKENAWTPASEGFFFKIVDIVYDYPQVPGSQIKEEIYNAYVESEKLDSSKELEL